MKTVRIVSELGLCDLARQLGGHEPLLLELANAPLSISRLDLLRAVCGVQAPLMARFGGELESPLVEIACLAIESEWEPQSRLNLKGALAAPLLFRIGECELVRLVARHGLSLDPGLVLRPFRGSAARSAVALNFALSLADASRAGSERNALARELAAFRFVMTLPDRVEGVRAFLEKRSPHFDW